VVQGIHNHKALQDKGHMVLHKVRLVSMNYKAMSTDRLQMMLIPIDNATKVNKATNVFHNKFLLLDFTNF